MGPKQTAQIAEPPQWRKSSLKFVMIRDTEEEKLGDGKSKSFQKLIRSHDGGVTKLYKARITCNNFKVDTTKTHSTTKISN